MDLDTRDNLTEQLRDAALAGDAALVMQLERERDEQSAVEFVESCKQLRDDIKSLEQEKAETSRERAALESMYALAAHAWRAAIDRADQLRQEWQRIGAQLGGMDSHLSIITEDLKEKRAALTALVNSRVGG